MNPFQLLQAKIAAFTDLELMREMRNTQMVAAQCQQQMQLLTAERDKRLAAGDEELQKMQEKPPTKPQIPDPPPPPAHEPDQPLVPPGVTQNN